ncbi:hypothetical protein KKA47_03315, partial [bacterium]|nr:hypothetical protein [bacterium]
MSLRGQRPWPALPARQAISWGLLHFVRNNKIEHMPQKKYQLHEAIMEAQRCLICEDAPCNVGCPAAVDAKGFIRKLRFEQLEGAARLIRDGNPLGASCAYICPSCGLCGKGCTSSKLLRAI